MQEGYLESEATVQVKEEDSLDQGGSSRIEEKRVDLKQIEDLVDWTWG